MRETIKEKIITYMETSQKQSFSMEQLSEGLGLTKGTDFKQLVQTIATMEREQLLIFTAKGKVKLPPQQVAIEGIFRANERGFGFVTISEEEDDVYISKEQTNYALNGDKVKIEILAPANYLEDRGAEGKVVEIVERALTQVVGEFVLYDPTEQQESDLYGYVIPGDKKMSQYKIYIAPNGIQPVDGAICMVEVTHYPEAGYAQALEGVVTQTLGHKNEPGMDILSIVMQLGIPTKFPEEVLAQADAVPAAVTAADLDGRRDLRDQVIVTIDGADAKDLDDAVTVHKLANGNFFLGVHIADVAHYVTEGSPLDIEAADRGTSVYLTDRVIPMIPPRLSNGICSLNPQVDRLTMSCEMEINPKGEVVRYDIFSSVIKTTARMTYQAVNQILTEQDETVIATYKELVPMFQTMAELHHLLEEMRINRGALSFEDHEAGIVVDAEGHPVDIVLRERGVGERLIESFMLMANETVAKHFCDAHLPFIYRVHEQPKVDKMQRFFEFATNFGLMIKGTKEDVSPKVLQDVLQEVEGRPEESMINAMLLRSMQQARYHQDSFGHYGLAADYYTHFTSPIRRYPDLIVHRLIKAYATQPVTTKTQDKWQESLPEIAQHSSQMERRAVEAERETDAMKKAEFMQDKVGMEFAGVISSITKFGMFIQLPNTVEGLIHLNKLPDYFHFIESHLALVGERSGVTYRIGQEVVIRVEKADPITREIDFSLVSAAELAPSEVLSVPANGRRQRAGGNKGRRETEGAGNKGAGKKSHTPGNDKGKGKSKGKKPYYKGVVKGKKGQAKVTKTKKNKNKKKKV